MDFKTPDHQCPTCGHVFNSAGEWEEVDGQPPQPGDFRVCIHCGEVMQFDANMQVVKSSHRSAEIRRLQRCIKHMHREMN